MPKFKADMDGPCNYSKVIKIQNIKRLFPLENDEWAIETTGGEFGTPSKKGVKRIMRFRPEIIEEPMPCERLLRWLDSQPEDNEEDDVTFAALDKP